MNPAQPAGRLNGGPAGARRRRAAAGISGLLLATTLAGCGGGADGEPGPEHSVFFGVLAGGQDPLGAEPSAAGPLDFQVTTGAADSPWAGVLAAAERANAPGTFTSFAGAEFAPGPHHPARTLIFRGPQLPESLPAAPVAGDPEPLWRWMDELRDQGLESLAVPEPMPAPDPAGAAPITDAATSSEASAPMGASPTADAAGPALDAAAAERGLRNEPLWQIAGALDAARAAWLQGVVLESTQGINPFQVGIVAARGSGLTGVWAEENTRAAVYDALRRRETFATSGPRITLRLTAGAVPMGGDLLPEGGNPRFVARASSDPRGAPLARLQIIKGWEAQGEASERRYDIACGDGQTPDPVAGRCPDPAGGRADDCAAMAAGAAELSATWQDPDFQAGAEAYYALVAIERPSCTRSAAAAREPGDGPDAGQRALPPGRAWSSPIWYHGSIR